MSRVVLELTAEQAAGLKRFAEKVGWSECRAVLYPHVAKETRDCQTSAIISAFGAVAKALDDLPTWPWIDTGVA